MSGHALIFRSRPIVKLNFTMKAENAGLVDPNGGSQDWRVCSHFTSRFQVPKICKNESIEYYTLNLKTTLNRCQFHF